MSVVAWVLIGLAAGFIGSKIVNRHGDRVAIDIALGIAGALAGGYLFDVFRTPGVTGLTLYSVAVTAGCSVLLPVVYRAKSRRARA